MDWFKNGKGPCLFNFYAECIMQNTRLDKAQAGIKIAGRNTNNLRYADDTTLIAKSEELKSLLMKVKEESEKAGLNSTFKKWRSWQIDGETMETVTDFIFLGFKITVDGDCSHKIKRQLLLGKKAMTNVDSILKSRTITLPAKVHLVKAMVFFSSHVHMWELDHKEDWAPKNWCFQTVVLEKTLESPLGCKVIKLVNSKWNQPWIFTGRTDAKAEAPILWPPDTKSQLIGKDPDAGKDWVQEEGGGGRRWDG